VNHYYRRVGNRTLISREGRAYRKRVCIALKDSVSQAITGRVRVRIDVHPPDRRRRDLDNAMKALLDALQHGGAYEDDSQIDHLDIRRGAVVPNGTVTVTLHELEPGSAP
jgi:crossover junction endodeoxyribonuclease RusA